MSTPSYLINLYNIEHKRVLRLQAQRQGVDLAIDHAKLEMEKLKEAIAQVGGDITTLPGVIADNAAAKPAWAFGKAPTVANAPAAPTPPQAPNLWTQE